MTVGSFVAVGDCSISWVTASFCADSARIRAVGSARRTRAQIGAAQFRGRRMIAGDGGAPIGGVDPFSQQDAGRCLSVVIGIERFVERAEDAGVVGDVDLEAAHVDVGITAGHDGQDGCDSVFFGFVVGSAAGGVDGPRPGRGTGGSGPSALDGADSGQDARRKIPVTFGFRGRDIAGEFRRSGDPGRAR